MANKDRLVDSAGMPIPFSCGNKRYRTNLKKALTVEHHQQKGVYSLAH